MPPVQPKSGQLAPQRRRFPRPRSPLAWSAATLRDRRPAAGRRAAPWRADAARGAGQRQRTPRARPRATAAHSAARRNQAGRRGRGSAMRSTRRRLAGSRPAVRCPRHRECCLRARRTLPGRRRSRPERETCRRGQAIPRPVPDPAAPRSAGRLAATAGSRSAVRQPRIGRRSWSGSALSRRAGQPGHDSSRLRRTAQSHRRNVVPP